MRSITNEKIVLTTQDFKPSSKKKKKTNVNDKLKKTTNTLQWALQINEKNHKKWAQHTDILHCLTDTRK